jgi:hypothetical protein
MRIGINYSYHIFNNWEEMALYFNEHKDSIKSLQFNNRRLTSLPEEIFSGLTSLETIQLGSNQLTTLPKKIFSGLTSLQGVALNENQLASLPDGIFSGLSTLKWLVLCDNRLASLPEGIFSGLISLRELDINNNQITSLPDGIFSGLTSLRELYIKNNPFTSLPSGIFSGLTALQELDVDVPLSLATIIRLKMTSPSISLNSVNQNLYYQWIEKLRSIKIKPGLSFEKATWWEPWCNVGSKENKETLLQKIKSEYPEVYLEKLDSYSKRELCQYLSLVYDTILSSDFDLIKKCVPDTDISGTHFSIGDVIGFEYGEGEYHCFSRNDFEKDPKLLKTNPYTMKKWSKGQVAKIKTFIKNAFYKQTVNIRPPKKSKITRCIEHIINAFASIGNNYVTDELVRKVVERSSIEDLLFDEGDVAVFNSNPDLESKICIVSEKIKDDEYLNDVYHLFNPSYRVIDEDTLAVPSSLSYERKSAKEVYATLINIQRKIMTLTNIRDMNERIKLSRERDQLLLTLDDDTREQLDTLIDEETDQDTKEIASIISDKM